MATENQPAGGAPAGQPAAGGEGQPAGTPPAAAGGAPAGGAPAGGTPPPAPVVAPAAGGAPPTGKPRGSNVTPPKGDKRRMVAIPEKEFRSRIDRETAKTIRDRFGMTPEELEARLKGAPAPAPGTPAAPAAAPVAPVVDSSIAEKNRRLQHDLDVAKGRIEKLKTDKEKIRSRERAKRTDLTLRTEALAVGIKGDDADFALELFKKAVRGVPEGQELPKPREFFTGLKDSRPYLFAGATPPPEVPLAPTTAGPTGAQPGGAAPAPVPPGGTQPTGGAKGVDDMTPEEFRAYKRRSYGSRY